MIFHEALHYITKLRNYGYPVCTDEICDFFQALNLLSIDEWKLNDIIHITLVKDEIQARVLDTILFFEMSDHIEDSPGDGEQSNTEFIPPEELKIQITQHIYLGDNNRIQKAIKQAIQYVSEQADFNNIEELALKVKVFLEWKITENNILKTEDPCLIANTRTANNILEQEIKIFWYKMLNSEKKQEFLRNNLLINKDLGSLRPEEQIIIEKHIQKLSRFLATKRSRRWKNAKKGIIDLKKNFNNIIKNNFISNKIYYKKPNITRTKLFVLCDISGSVSSYALFLLQLVQGLYNIYRNVRAFVFVDEVAEITQLLDQKIMSKEVITELFNSNASLTGFSNYEFAGRRICELLPDHHYPHSILIVLGDCRTNYQQAGISHWQSLCSKFTKTILINPEPAERWNQDDSQVKDFLPMFNYFFECRNIKQLESIIKYLL